MLYGKYIPVYILASSAQFYPPTHTNCIVVLFANVSYQQPGVNAGGRATRLSLRKGHIGNQQQITYATRKKKPALYMYMALTATLTALAGTTSALASCQWGRMMLQHNSPSDYT